MLSEILKKELETFFIEKKYETVIKISEKKLVTKEIPSSLSNLIGICKILKKERTTKDVFSALTYFEEAYLKGKKTIHGLNGLTHLISIGLQFLKGNSQLKKFMTKANNFYLEAENNFKKNEVFLSSGLLLYSHFLDHKKQKEISNQVLNGASQSKYLRSKCLFEKNYSKDWSQKNHFENAIINSKYFNKLKVKEIKEIDYNKNEKINIGFISSDFEKNHSITFFIKNTIKYLDKKKFKTSLFSLAKKNTEDRSQNELRSLADDWIDCKKLDNQQLVNLIQEKRINIIFDIMGFTYPNRLEIFKSRIAPIQVSWLAYCNTVGFETIDFIIADNNLILKNEEKFYSEKIVRLPNIWSAHSGFSFKREFINLPFKKEQVFTFGSFNNFKKISDETVDVWSSILKNTSNSRLLLKSSTFCDATELLKKFKKNGVAHKIEIFEKENFLKKKDHLDLYKKIDLALDTFPYNGVTTTFEALWMGVPTIVLKGYNFNSRCGESIIANAEIDYLIALNTKDYIQKAILLSQDKKKLTQIRKLLFDQVLSTPLFDTQGFAKNFGDCFFEIFNNKSINKN